MKQTLDLGGFVQRWIDSTADFVRDCIGAEPDPQQLLFLNAIDDMTLNKERGTEDKIGVQVDSGKGLGKTSALSWIILKWLVCYEGCKILCTAPKQDLLRDNLWGEFSKWIRYGEEHGNGFLTEWIGIQADKVFNTFDEKGTVCLARVSSRTASQSDKEATLQGYHAEYMMLIADEAYGCDDAVFNPLEGTMTQKVNFMVLTGNPSKNVGYVADCETKNKHKWELVRMNGELSTLVTSKYIDNMREKYEDDENGYRTNVLGLKPLDEEDSLIPYAAINECMSIDASEFDNENDGVVFGSDIGGGGTDTSATIVRKGPVVLDIKTKSSPDTKVIARWIEGIMDVYDPVKIAVDGIGHGHGTYDELRADYGSMVTFVDARKKPSVQGRYKNLRAELYWKLAQKIINHQICLPDNDQLRKELASIKKVNKDVNSLQIMSKIEMKKAGVASPNLADALALTMYFNDRAVQIAKNSKDDMQSRYHNTSEDNEFSWMSA